MPCRRIYLFYSLLFLTGIVLNLIDGEGGPCDTPDCSCVRGTMTCTGSTVQYLPSFNNTEENISVFIFSDCAIRVIKEVPYVNAITLDIRRCTVESIEDGAFSHLTQLTKLVLSDNLLTRLSNLTFEGLSNLTKLDISGNSLLNVSTGVFDNLQNLKELDLSENNIDMKTVFRNSVLASVKELKCEDCQLNEIPNEIFKNFRNLQKLYLNANNFSVIPSAAFQDLKSLRTLGLNGCKIEKINNTAFTGLTNIQELDLGYNALTAIVHDTFAPFFYSLTTLRLEKNKLQTMIEGTALWNNMTVFNLEENPWTCDCLIAWMKDYKTVDKKQVICASPTHLKGKSLDKLQYSEFCSPPSTRSTAVLVITTIIIIISVVLIIYYLRKIMRNRRRRALEAQSFQYRSIYGDTVETNSRQNILA